MYDIGIGVVKMSSVQIEQKSYEMPPREGISIAHFLTVADIERSSACEYLDDSERWRRADPG
jgi:hypothetical protein